MSEPRVQRRLAAILAADVVGYSRLMGEDEAGTLAALKARWKDVLTPLLGQFGGRLVKMMGDGVLVEFASAVDAVQCGIELQRAFAGANEPLTPEKHIILRIGINLGDVIVDGEDLYGDGVNIAARLEALAEPGGICISASVHDQVSRRLPVRTESMGPQSLKNIAQPVSAYRLTSAAPATMTERKAERDSSSERLSIAVLPFQNMSGDPEQEYFADGMVEDIITALARFKSLFVIARNSSFTYKAKAIDIKTVGRELGVSYVLEGSVRRSGERLRVTAQLINASSGEHVWAERYDASIKDVFDLQDDLARTITATLEGRIVANAGERSRSKPTRDWQAYDYFLQGREHNHQYNPPEAERCFARAVELDPDYAEAYAHRAGALAIIQWGEAESDLLQSAEQYAAKALALDPRNAVCHQAAGYVALCQKKYDLAGVHLKRAVELNPNDAPIVAELANWYSRIGDARTALTMLDEVMRRDPSPPSWFWEMRYRALFHLHDYQNALVALNNITGEATIGWREAYRAAVLVGLGRLDEARAAAAKYASLVPGASLSMLARAEPYADHSYHEQLVQNLRAAGLPE